MSEHPDVKLRRMVDSLFDHAKEHGIKLSLEIRWPNGMQHKQRHSSDRELKAAAARASKGNGE